MDAPAIALLDWCRAAEGRAQRRFPPGRARLGPGPHVCGCPRDTGCHATRLAPSSGGESETQLPAGLSPAWTGAPRVWAQRPLRHSVGAEQQREGSSAPLLRAEPGSGPGPTRMGSTANICYLIDAK